VVGCSTGVIERRKDGVTQTFGNRPNAGGQIHYLYEGPQGGAWAAWGQRITRFQNGKFEGVSVERGLGVLGRQNLNPAASGHYGLIGRRERAERIGGHLTLTSGPGKGPNWL